MQFFGVNESKIRWTDLEIKFIKGKTIKEKLGSTKSKGWHYKSGKDHKNREKNLQFFGVNDSKIRWTDLEIKFIKGKTIKENWEVQNQNVGIKNLEKIIKIEKKICNFLV